MGSKLYVGNLSFNATEDSLHALFASVGNVQSCKIIIDRDTGRSKGFAFVEMSSSEEAESAIQKLNGSSFEGRPLNISEARPMQPRSPGGGGGGGGRGEHRGGGHRGW
jgi:RNA recognition motif-containing protein